MSEKQQYDEVFENWKKEYELRFEDYDLDINYLNQKIESLQKKRDGLISAKEIESNYLKTQIERHEKQ